METTPGKRVQLLREAKGYKSLTAFAEYTGLKVGTLSALEADRSAPSLETLSKLRRAFPDLNMDWLIDEAGPMLRDGRALTPVMAAATFVAGPASGIETVDHALEIMLRGQLLSRLADKDELIGMLRAENEELRGKSPGSSDAAGSYAALPPTPHVPVVGFQLSVQRRARGRAHMSR